MPRRILLLVTDLEIGGTPTVVRELATRLRDAAHIEVASLKGLGHNGDLLSAAGINVTALNARSVLSLPLIVRRVRRLIEDRRIDTVVSFLVHANLVAALSVPRDVRLIESIQTTQPNPRWHWTAQAWAAGRAERVLVPSASVVNVGVQRSGISREKFVVIPNAIDPEAFERSAIPSTDPRPYPLGFIGRLDPVKHVDHIISGLEIRNAIKSDVHLHIFGEGPERPKIEQAIRDASAESWVVLHGATRSPQEALSQIGALILASEAEGFGLVLIEAMAAGVPVIGTRVPGIHDVIRHGQTGLLVEFPSPASMHFAVETIIEEMETRHRLVEAGLREVRERFSWDVVLPQYRELLNIDQS